MATRSTFPCLQQANPQPCRRKREGLKSRRLNCSALPRSILTPKSIAAQPSHRDLCNPIAPFFPMHGRSLKGTKDPDSLPKKEKGSSHILELLPRTAACPNTAAGLINISCSES